MMKKDSSPQTSSSLVLLLDDIRSVQNVASIFRIADCAGISHIYLGGYTPAPIDRFGRSRKDFSKISLGSEKTVPFSQGKTTDLMISLKNQGYCLVALEQSKDSIDYKDFKLSLSHPTVLLIGNEPFGIPQETLDICDEVIEIPQRGEKESLNVAIATGIAVFRILGI